MSKIAIVVGHGKSKTGGYDSGAVANGFHEFKIAKECAKYAQEYLNANYECQADLFNYAGDTYLTDRVAKFKDNTYTLLAEIHLNTQLTICGGFAPNSSSADVVSKALGSKTVMSGSVSRSKNDPSQSLQMIERPLMTPDELKSLPKGQFIVMKTGVHPMKVKLKLFFEWGIEFEKGKEYELQGHENRKVEYADKKEIMDGIVKKYHQDWLLPPQKSQAGADTGGQSQIHSESNEPNQSQTVVSDEKKDKSGKGGGRGLKTTAPINRGKVPEVNPSEQT